MSLPDAELQVLLTQQPLTPTRLARFGRVSTVCIYTSTRNSFIPYTPSHVNCFTTAMWASKKP
jgi:hypothetical protein